MKKEVLIAIIIGFGLGLVITFGIWTANKSIKNEDAAPEPTAALEGSPTPEPSPELYLTLAQPEDEMLSDEETITVEGETVPEAIVVVLFPEGEKILEADSDGSFSTEIELAGGINEIKVSAFDDEGNEIEETITVVYSTSEL